MNINDKFLVARSLSMTGSTLFRKAAAFALLLLVVGNSGCYGTRLLDETVFHEGPKYTLKAVRYYTILFLSYNGEVFSIQCRSAGTANFRAKERQDKGWNSIFTARCEAK